MSSLQRLFARIYVCVRQNIPLAIFDYIQLCKIRVALNGTAYGEKLLFMSQLSKFMLNSLLFP